MHFHCIIQYSFLNPAKLYGLWIRLLHAKPKITKTETRPSMKSLKPVFFSSLFILPSLTAIIFFFFFLFNSIQFCSMAIFCPRVVQTIRANLKKKKKIGHVVNCNENNEMFVWTRVQLHISRFYQGTFVFRPPARPYDQPSYCRRGRERTTMTKLSSSSWSETSNLHHHRPEQVPLREHVLTYSPLTFWYRRRSNVARHFIALPPEQRLSQIGYDLRKLRPSLTSLAFPSCTSKNKFYS